MFANELVDHITQQTNLYFKENIVGKIFKKHSRIQKHLSSASSKSELCIANEIRLFIASILYRGVDQKPVAHIFYTKNKLFETPGFTKILPQDRLVVSEKYIYFVDISILGESYNRSAKIEPIHEYLVERWQSLLTHKKISLLMKPCFSGKVAWPGSNSSGQSEHVLGWKALFSQKRLLATSGLWLFTQAMIHWLKKETHINTKQRMLLCHCVKKCWIKEDLCSWAIGVAV